MNEPLFQFKSRQGIHRFGGEAFRYKARLRFRMVEAAKLLDIQKNFKNSLIPIETWIAPWQCSWSKKEEFTFAPDYSGIDPCTGKPWSPIKVVKLMGLVKASMETVEIACQKVITANPKQTEIYKSGKKNLIGFFIKSVMDETNKQADPKTAKEILEKLLEG